MTVETLTKKQLKSASFRKKKKTDDVDAVVDVEEEDKDDRVVERSQNGNGEGLAEQESKSKANKKHGKSKANEEEAVSTSSASISIAADKKEKKEQKRKLREEREKEAKEGIKARPIDDEDDDDARSKKRKRSEDKSVKAKAVKKRFTEDGEVAAVEVVQKAEDLGDKKEDKRYIVFVGNMSFKSTPAEIAKHFSSHCTETPSVRLLSKKGDASKLAQLPKSKQKSIAKGKAADPSASISKGCAFLEFKNASALQKALQFHHTQFQGRNINVELTAGGGGKGNDRKEKIRKKNQDLEAERQKIHEKYVKGGKKEKEGEGAKAGEVATEKKEAPPAKPAWGPRAAGKARPLTKVPKWAASGSNAVRLSG
ncbi:hypothetical protein CBS101457_000770 [Exobasidium rhododendri]|nr:hypothetical protein CBS101457_000770 [Exobasidium rhododendri]